MLSSYPPLNPDAGSALRAGGLTTIDVKMRGQKTGILQNLNDKGTFKKRVCKPYIIHSDKKYIKFPFAKILGADNFIQGAVR